jgi:hypothetical protein
MAKYQRYMPIIVAGYFLWTIGAALKCFFTLNTRTWVIVITFVIEGSGAGFTLQPCKFMLSCELLFHTQSAD